MRCPDPGPVRTLAALAVAVVLATPALADPQDQPAQTQPAQTQPAQAPALATGQVDGPVELGPSWAEADPQRSAATLHTILANQGTVADRLIQVRCPYSGQVALVNGTPHPDVMAPNPAQESRGAQEARNAGTEQNGLDLPPTTDGRPVSVQADFRLVEARQPLAPGALIPCTVNLAHGGERIVVFTVGPKPDPVTEP